MKIEFQLDENDFLTYQLYSASTSERIKKKRMRDRIILPLIYFGFGLLLYFFENKLDLLFIFFGIAIIWYIVYPIWERRHYIKHYKSFIKENYQGRLGRTAVLEFTNDNIMTKENGSESKVPTLELEEIIEIPTMIFFKLKSGQSIILPKEKIISLNSLTTKLKEQASHLNINYNLDNNWEWK